MAERERQLPALSSELQLFSRTLKENMAANIALAGKYHINSHLSGPIDIGKLRTPEGLERLYAVIGEKNKLLTALSFLEYGTKAETNERTAINLDDDRYFHSTWVKSNDIQIFPLAESSRKEALQIGCDRAKSRFLSLLEKKNLPLLPYRKDLLEYNLTPHIVDDGREVVAEFETKLKNVYYQCFYPEGADFPRKAIIIDPV